MNGMVILSASYDVPSFLFSFCADAWPAVFLVRQQIFGTLDIGNDVGTRSLEGLCAGDHCSLNVDSALDFQGSCALFCAVEVVDGFLLKGGGGFRGLDVV
jgi:hypothetical protein